MVEAIMAAGQTLGAGINAWSQARENKKSRQFSLQMYDKQRADNLDMWNKENSYNSPQEQMKRLKEAGLNPNLVYGASSPSGQGGSISSADAHKPNFEAPRYGDMLSSLGSFMDYQMKTAQIDNVQANTDVAKETSAIKMLEQIGLNTENLSKDLKLKMDSELYQTSVDHAKETLRQVRANTQYTLDQNERAWAMLQPNVQNAVEDILSKRLGRELTAQQITNLGLEEAVKKLYADTAKRGINPNDPIWARALGMLVGELEQKFKNGFGKIDGSIPKKMLDFSLYGTPEAKKDWQKRNSSLKQKNFPLK